MSQSPIFISEAQSSKLINRTSALNSARAALIAVADRTGVMNPVIVGRGTREDESYAVKSGVASQAGLIGMKVGSYWPKNDERGIPRHSASTILIDPDTGRILALVEVNRANSFRTAAADAAAVDALARTSARRLAIIGAGHQAEFEALAVSDVRELTHVFVSSRTPSSAERLAEKLSSQIVGAAVQATSVNDAVANADIIICASTSTMPLFEPSLVRPGTHISSMGSDQAGKQELDIELVQRASLFCDFLPQSVEIGEFQHVKESIERGSISVTELGAVLNGGQTGRNSEDEITIFDSSGVAIQDLFIASELLRLAGAK